MKGTAVKNPEKQPQQNRGQHQRRQAKAEARVAKRTAREQKEKQRFVEPLTGKRAMHIAKANANLEYRPIERAIQSEIKGSQKREGEIGQWYGGLDNLIAQQQAAGKASDQAATDAINSQVAGANAQSAEGLQQIAAQNASRATLAGGAASPTLQSTAALGNANLAATRTALNAPTIQAQSSFQKFTGGRRVSAAERGIEARKANASTRRKMMQDKLNARLEKGRAITSGLSKLREGERDYRIQNKAFSLNKQEAAQNAANDAASQRTSARNARTSETNAEIAAKNAATSARNAANSERGTNISGRNAKTAEKKANREAAKERYEREHPGKTGGPTQSQKYNANQESQSVRKAIPDTLKRYRSAGHPIKSPAEVAEFTAEIAKITGAEYSVAAREVQRFFGRQQPSLKVGSSHR